jgi:hypothetical protein
MQMRFGWLQAALGACIGLGFMCSAFAGAAVSHTWDMDLRWNYIKLGQVEFISTVGDGEERLEIIGKTAGPLRLVKNYDGRGLLVRKGAVDSYTLEGTDGGVDEIRRILFEQGQLPKVLQFKDSGAKNPLEPAEPWGLEAWAPMALVQRVLKSSANPQLCSGRFTVFDGKRRYQVMLTGTPESSADAEKADTEKTVPLRRLAQCTSVLLGDSLYETQQPSPQGLRGPDQEVGGDLGSTTRMRKVWLFGQGDRRIDFIFSGGCAGALLTGIKFYSPVGAIVARSIGGCLS